MKTKQHIKNLKKLKKFILEEITDKQFNMEEYRNVWVPSYHANFNDCGTVGCALGWTPFAFPSLNKPFDFDRNSLLLFGFYWGSNDWDFLFSSDHSETMPTRQDFALRCDMMIDIWKHEIKE